MKPLLEAHSTRITINCECEDRSELLFCVIKHLNIENRLSVTSVSCFRHACAASETRVFESDPNSRTFEIVPDAHRNLQCLRQCLVPNSNVNGSCIRSQSGARGNRKGDVHGLWLVSRHAGENTRLNG